MAYYVSSSFDANVAEGPLAIRAGVSPANVDRAVASIDEELTRLRRDGLTREGARRIAAGILIGSMPRALETNGGIANFLQTAEFFGLGLDYDVRLPEPASRRDARRGERRARRRAWTRSARPSSSPDRTATACNRMIRAVFFDVDFTLIYPGPTFRGEGLSGVLRAVRHRRSIRRGSTRRRERGAAPRRARGRQIRSRRSSSPIRATSSSGWAARARGSTRARARSTPSGRRASTSSCTTTCRAVLATAGGRRGRASG